MEYVLEREKTVKTNRIVREETKNCTVKYSLTVKINLKKKLKEILPN